MNVLIVMYHGNRDASLARGCNLISGIIEEQGIESKRAREMDEAASEVSLPEPNFEGTRESRMRELFEHRGIFQGRCGQLRATTRNERQTC